MGVGMEICKANALLAQAVEVGRFKNRIAVAGEISHALIIGDDNENVGFGGGSRHCGGESTKAEQKQDGGKNTFHFSKSIHSILEVDAPGGRKVSVNSRRKVCNFFNSRV